MAMLLVPRTHIEGMQHTVWPSPSIHLISASQHSRVTMAMLLLLLVPRTSSAASP